MKVRAALNFSLYPSEVEMRSISGVTKTNRSQILQNRLGFDHPKLANCSLLAYWLNTKKFPL